ncbi:valine--tRNA ligase [Spirochaeta cellobiosiphila]|uniref:valine--tRNA ligase n=1 Tax=Spirochaeta cellobiosiphila TaxID=504483 RepID=UPI0004208CF1|nr:valine--tRNA ligase [Spirochaeta cellobiosiphila]
MKSSDLAKAFNPSEFEDRIYQDWMNNGVFKPKAKEGVDPFTIVIPPPNVTGVLHMGHGLNNSLQDILIRYYRMKGRPTLWVPGTDHAGIATQNVVERQLRAKGLSRHDLGREEFVKETWKVKEKHHSIISKQLQKIGASCDWSHERFTMDEGLSDAVREVFVSLYEKGLIYKGNYLVNWCSSCGTAIADDEVEYSEKSGRLYRFKYPFAEGNGSIEIETTRPETMYGDTAVAVNPDDERYHKYIGKELILPLVNRRIKIIGDPYVDKAFGSGAVKITPAHDPNDYEIGKRHNLDEINILTPDGKLNDNVPEALRGLDIQTARKETLKLMEEAGLYIDSKDHNHQVGHCYRCNTVIEPYLSEQWYVKMKPLAEKAMEAWETNEITFYPKKWENTYKSWLSGIRDWCISRQLWWGHRIPVWYCKECNNQMVLRHDPESCDKCGSHNLIQDEDVLDTWFSSWLWPFSTLGWPEKTQDLDSFYPTSALVTGYDIIFFWVARMVMAGKEFMGKAPFKDIYITSLVRDKQGRKMSKSLGNGIDPLDVVGEYGADAMKFTLAYMCAQGQDILIDTESFKLGSKFANKIWNASRYILMNLEGRQLVNLADIELSDLDKWIYHQLNEASRAVDKAISHYRFNDATHIIYDFFWNDFCDWYIEGSKLSLYSQDEQEKDRSVTLLISVLKDSLKLMHPFLSFITEELYQYLPDTEGFIAEASYPEFDEARCNPTINENFSIVQDLIKSIRTIRSEFTISPEKTIPVKVKSDDVKIMDVFEKNSLLIKEFVKASSISFDASDNDKTDAIAAIGKGFEAYIYIKDIIDMPAEIAKLKKNIAKTEKLFKSTEGKLKNEKFLNNAPDDVVAKEKDKLEEFSSTLDKQRKYLLELQ